MVHKRFGGRRLLAWLACAAVMVSCAGWAGATTTANVGFTVTPQLPENQRSSNSYFDLRVTPGQAQTLTVQIANQSNEEMTALVQVNDASTSKYGMINYQNHEYEVPAGQVSLRQIATVQEEQVTIPAGSTGEARIHLQLPGEAFPGIVLGAVRIIKALPEEVEDTAIEATGVAIQNQYSYTIAVLLTEEEEPNQQTPQDFALRAVRAERHFGQSALFLEIDNLIPSIVTKLQMDISVTADGASAPVIERSMDGIEMAPLAVMDYVMEYEETLEPGDYTLRIRLTLGQETWDLESGFTVS